MLRNVKHLQNCIIGPSTPIFFILSPGVNPLKDVEALGKKLGYTGAHKNFHNVSLGQGQEVVAEAAMATAAKGKILFLISLMIHLLLLGQGNWSYLKDNF